MKILIVEDDEETAAYIRQGLSEAGHTVDCTTNGHDGLFLAAGGDYDVMVFDRMLPVMDGLTLVKMLRGSGVRTPVLFLTNVSGIDDRVEGLEAGGDDYLVKPFAFSELAARIQALGRRLAPPVVATKLQANGIEMDLLTREVRREGRSIALQPREYRLLEELMRHAGEFVTRTMLLERIWDFHFDPQTKIVETHMSRLRAKLNEGFAQDAIETVRGVGYRMRAA